MEQENKPDLFNNNLSFDLTAREYLRSIASWAMIIVGTTVIGYVISLLQAFFAPAPKAPRAMEGFESNMPIATTSPLWTVISIIIGLIVNYFLYRFAMQIRKGLKTYDQKEMSSSFGNLKLYFIIISIMFLLMFLVIVLGLAALAL